MNFKKGLNYIVVPTVIISLTACLFERKAVSKEVKKIIEDLKFLNNLGKENKSNTKAKRNAVSNSENDVIAIATQAIIQAESTQLQTEIELYQYLKNCSIDELNELASELIRVGILDIRSNFRDGVSIKFLADSLHNLPVYLNHFTLTKENDGWLNVEQYHKEILYACTQLVKMDMNADRYGSIRGAKFYNYWNDNGYIDQIKNSFKRKAV